MKKKIWKYLKIIKQQMNEIKVDLRLSSMQKPFVWLLGIYIIFTSSIIRADFKYSDDLGRCSFGYRGWGDFSRYVSKCGATLLHDGNYLTDISPLTHWLALAIMALAGVIMLRCFIKTEKIPWYGILLILPTTLSPYFLECLSYKFDSPYIALSVLGSIFPFLWWRKKICYFIMMSLIGLLVMFNTYQASSGIYIIMAVFMLLQDFINGECVRNTIKKCSIVIGIYLVSAGIYKGLFVKEIDTYVSSSMPPLNKLFDHIFNNVKIYFKTIKEDLPKRWLIYVYAIGSMVVITSCYNAQKRRWLSVILSVFAVGGCAILSYGLYLVLAKPLFAPRGMYGIGVYASIMATFLVGCNKSIYLDKIVCFCLAWSCAIYSLTYGNALAEEKRYTDFRTEMTLMDLNKILPKNRNNVQVQILGNASRSPIIDRMAKKYPVIKRVVPIHFNNSYWSWSDAYFFNYFAFPKIQKVYPDKDNFSKLNLPVILETNYHTIKSDGTHVLIEVR